MYPRVPIRIYKSNKKVIRDFILHKNKHSYLRVELMKIHTTILEKSV